MDRKTITKGYQEHLERWYKKIDKYHFDAFVTAANSIKAHQQEILNYFFNRRINSWLNTTLLLITISNKIIITYLALVHLIRGLFIYFILHTIVFTKFILKISKWSN